MEKIKLAIWGIGLYGTFLKMSFDLSGPEDMEPVCYGDDELSEKPLVDGIQAVSTDELAGMYQAGNVIPFFRRYGEYPPALEKLKIYGIS